MECYDKAFAVFKQGIECVPPNKSLASLYISYSEMLVQIEENDMAIDVLQQGIECIPPNNSLADLFNTHSKLLVQMKRYDEALNVLQRGIKYIPTDKSLVILYRSKGEILAILQRYNEAITVLKEGIRRIPTDKSLTSLYCLCGDLLVKTSKTNKAITVLKHGIDRIPPDKSLSALYTRCSDLLFRTGKRELAMSLLEEGINDIPLNKGLTALYNMYAKLLIFSGKTPDAIRYFINCVNISASTQTYLASVVESIILLYAALQDDKKIVEFIQERKGLPLQYTALAQTLIYHIRNHWENAAEYARNVRKSGIRYPLLATIEAFSWLCCGQAERALDAIFANLKEEQSFHHWLHSFIQLRLDNFEEAKQALATYDGRLASLQEIDEATLLNLWDRPSTTLEQYDLAYYFPILPTALTGLPHSVTRVVYHPSVLPAHIKSKKSSHSQPIRKRENGIEGINPRKVETMPEEYIDFDLHIEASGHATASSLEGEASAHISTQVPSNIRLSLKLIEQRQTDAELLKEVGHLLYDWLFPNSIHTHLRQTEAVARRDKVKLRLRLRIEASTIASLPLEFIYRSEGGYFLATNPDTVLSRYLNLPLPQEYVRRRQSPLHMLAIVADPTDQVRLDPDEWETIMKEALDKPLTDNQMTLYTVKRATRKGIRDALLKQKPDIIQFIGHGIYQNGKGYLALVDEETDQTWLVDDERFTNLFAGYIAHLGLIGMATCESATSDNPQGFLGIAPQLVQRGIPAVVAMQYKVFIKTAKIFLEDFYTCVAAHKPIDWAVQSARNAVSLELELSNREFATPVLYMRAKDGNVFG
ncbi:MAG: CHAT domain-containing protein [Cyanobacteriota bacterium]|nr:CHAT domain-containing protein [Cyanobacteriota bacterium]